MICEGTGGTWMSCRKEKKKMRLESERENVKNSKNSSLDWEMMVGGLLALKMMTALLNGRWWLWNAGLFMLTQHILVLLRLISPLPGHCQDSWSGDLPVLFFSHKVYFCSPVTPAATESRRFCFCLISLRNGSFPLTSFVFPDQRGIQLPPGCGICEWIPISEGIHLLLLDKQHKSLTVSTKVYTLNL